MNPTNLSHMTIIGWESKYREILRDFGYSRKKDNLSCKLLNSLLVKKTRTNVIRDLIENKPVFVIGAGPSLPTCISILKKHEKITKIVADGATKAMIENVKYFKNCIGTTQTKPIGKVNNFGGFTDGDRCVFLADNFKAKKIILLGMDFGTRIGKYSKSKVVNRTIKIAKLRRGKKLLEWLALKSESELYSTSRIKGFTQTNLRSIDNIITSN